MKVAFIGLGDIGRPMAAHIAKRFPLVVWNRTASKAEAFAAAHGSGVAGTPREAANERDVIVVCLPTTNDVHDVLFGESGAAGAMKAGALVIDCTSGEPAPSRAIARRLAERGVDYVDAPVSGGVAGAEAGELTVMAGGGADATDRARAVIETFAVKIVHCGDTGAGHAVKAANQALLAVTIWATGEVLAALVKTGLDPATALEVINASSGRSNASQNLIPERVLTRAFPRTFRLALLDKDVRIALNLAREAEVGAPFTELAARLFAAARAELGEEADHVEAVRVIEREAGVELR